MRGTPSALLRHGHVNVTCLRPPHCDPLYLLEKLRGRYDHAALFESADRAHGVNNFSFLALGAREIVEANAEDPLVPLEGRVSQERVTGLLRMGYVGFLSFEAARHFDAFSIAPDPNVPDGYFFLPEVILRIDHKQRTVEVLMHEGAQDDLESITRAIESSPFFDDSVTRPMGAMDLPSLQDIEPYRRTSREEYCSAVRKAQEYILAGEAFQTVLSQELQLPALTSPIEAYQALRSINPSPYMYYLETPDRTIVGASPETLLRVDGDRMLYRPIAGTRKRTGDEAKDALMQEELLHDEKECAEHQMLVDLGRNDIGRVAEIGSVRVENPFHIERYAHVFHLVSDVTGLLRSDLTSFDALRSVFPAGTLSGAPKIRAVEIIRALEGVPRGVYGGAVGYVDLCGNLDFAITIRTLVFEGNKISLRVGAGIVKDSVPEHEDNECLHKARSCLAAVFQAASVSATSQ